MADELITVATRDSCSELLASAMVSFGDECRAFLVKFNELVAAIGAKPVATEVGPGIYDVDAGTADFSQEAITVGQASIAISVKCQALATSNSLVDQQALLHEIAERRSDMVSMTANISRVLTAVLAATAINICPEYRQTLLESSARVKSLISSTVTRGVNDKSPFLTLFTAGDTSVCAALITENNREKQILRSLLTEATTVPDNDDELSAFMTEPDMPPVEISNVQDTVHLSVKYGLLLDRLSLNSQQWRDRVNERINQHWSFHIVSDQHAEIREDDRVIARAEWELLGIYRFQPVATVTPADDNAYTLDQHGTYYWSWVWSLVNNPRTSYLKQLSELLPKGMQKIASGEHVTFHDPMMLSYIYAYYTQALQLDYVHTVPTDSDSPAQAIGLHKTEWLVTPVPTEPTTSSARPE